MAPLPLPDAIPRFKQNEDRVDQLVNGSDTTTWTSRFGVVLPSFAKLLRDLTLAFNNPLAQVLAARDAVLAALATIQDDLSEVSHVVRPATCGVRLSATRFYSACPVDVDRSPNLWVLPHEGGDTRVALYNPATFLWELLPVDPDAPIRLTQTVAGNTTNGSNVVTNVTNVERIRVGDFVIADGVGTGVSVASVNVGANTITLSAAATQTVVANRITISLNAGMYQVFDVFLRKNDTTGFAEPVLRSWTNSWERQAGFKISEQDGVLVMDSNKALRLLGSFAVWAAVDTGTFVSDTQWERMVSNVYNRVHRSFLYKAKTANHELGVTDWRVADGQSGDAKVRWVAATPREVSVQTTSFAYSNLAAGQNPATVVTPAIFAATGIGIDCPSNLNPQNNDQATIQSPGWIKNLNDFVSCRAEFDGFSQAGMHFASWLEWGQAPGATPTITYFGTFTGGARENITQSGMSGSIWN